MQIAHRPRGRFRGRDRSDRRRRPTTSTAQRRGHPRRSRFRPRWPTRPTPPGSICSKSLSMYSDELMEMLLAEEEPPRELDLRRDALGRGRSWSLRRCCWARPIATRACNCCWTPWSGCCPRRWTADTKAFAKDREGHQQEMTLTPDPEKPTVAMAFKMVEDPVRHADVHAGVSGPVRQGRHVLQPAHRPQGAVQPHRADARRPARGHRRGRGRRHRGRAWASIAPAATRMPRSATIARCKTCSCPSRSFAWPSPR